MVIVFLKWTLSCGWKDWPKDLFVNSKQWIHKRGKPQILPTYFLMKWALKRGTLFVSSTGPWPQTKFIVTFDTCFWYSFSGSFTWCGLHFVLHQLPISKIFIGCSRISSDQKMVEKAKQSQDCQVK